MEVIKTEIKVKTGFFEIQSFNLTLGTEKMVLCSDVKNVIIPYDKLQKIIIAKKKDKSTKLEIITETDIIEGIFTDDRDSDILEDFFKNIVYKHIQINFKDES